MFLKLKPTGFEHININFDRFFTVLKSKGQSAEVTWKEVFLSFDWQFEKDKISEYINSMESKYNTQYEEVIEAFYDHEGDIDLQMVQHYIEYSSSPRKHYNQKKFYKIIRENKERIQ